MADESDRYVYRIHWSNEDDGFVATVAELPDLRFIAQSSLDALAGLRVLASERVAAMRSKGQNVPEPFEDRHYSGHIMVRVPPEVHRRLTIEAAEQGVSLNRLVQSRLTQSTKA
ncbi:MULTISPECIES: type II toxin-antitoxin system HicB family antitoxin [Bifidobacterium]|uniref:type II toxin-antitoxin system HicB family antitoxin n=1 Tax=Bifidobacterium TaxID=1678 RepID=UPI001BDCB872|nr:MULTISPECIES: type II toxin-antitoxin system HicB family antitoxin [Bifidobacterium]MBT1161159.1 type II toxin-antitoxin system HicB family antitoxin [Bifidobacterium sp. SO1]MBW3078247.1 type II toxin-antitoxin system HicB family antitoxin [Bifidobacterium simiiventris]